MKEIQKRYYFPLIKVRNTSTLGTRQWGREQRSLFDFSLAIAPVYSCSGETESNVDDREKSELKFAVDLLAVFLLVLNTDKNKDESQKQ